MMTLKWHYEDNEDIKNNVAHLVTEAIKELSEKTDVDREILFERITGVMFLAEKIMISNDLDQYRREAERAEEEARRKAKEAEKNAAGS